MKLKLLLLTATLLQMWSCVSFESVKSVAKIGTSFEEHKLINAEMLFLCVQLTEEGKSGEVNCDGLDQEYDKLNSGLGVLKAYSDALLLAIEDDKFKFSDIVEQTAKAGNTANFFTLNDNQIAGIKTIAGAIQPLLVSAKKRAELRKTIVELDPNVDGACNDILRIIASQKLMLNTYKLHVINDYNIEKGFRSELIDSVKIVSIQNHKTQLKNSSLNNDILFLVQKYIRDQDNRLDIIQKAIQAFKDGHKILADKSSKIGGKDDFVVLGEIAKSIKDTFNGIEKFNTEVK